MKKFKSLLPIFILSVFSFLTATSMDKIEFSDNRCLLNEADEGKQFYADTNEIVNLSKYDPRDELTPVKDQGDTNLCWAYSTINASEASILKHKIGLKDTLRLNPKALAYRKYVRNADPLGNNAQYIDKNQGNWLYNSGAISQTPSLLSMWQGPVDGDKPAIDVYTNSLYRLESANLISSNATDEERILEIKNAIAEYGAVTASVYYDGGSKQYYNDKAVTNGIPHAITLIGWDDTLDKSLFKPGTVTRNGGWLVKNSYNDNPYFYLTYESKIAATTAWSFTYQKKEAYDYNYYYDNSVDDFSLRKTKTAANVYQAKKETDDEDEYIEAINIGFFGNDVDVKVKIYTDLPGWEQTYVEKGTLKASKTEHFKYGGYQTIRLDEPVKVSLNSYFSIVCEVSNANNDAIISLTQSDSKKPSFENRYYGYDYILNGGYVARIKAYTKCKKKEAEHVHDFNNPTYVFSEDNKKVTATRICKTDESHIETETVSTTSAIIKEPTCIEKGTKRITSDTFKNPAFTVQTKDVDLGNGDHVYGEWIDRVEPTSEKEGTLAHKDCLVCHKHFDADNHEITDLSIPMLPKTVKVTIVNGTTSEENPVVGTSITVVADKPKDGMRFVGWRDEKGSFISTEETITFFVTEDVYLEAVYEKIKTDPVETSKPSEPIETSKPTEPIKPSDSIETSKPSEIAKPSEPDKTTEPVTPEKPDEQEKEPLSAKEIAAIAVVSSVSCFSIIGVIIYLIIKRKL